MTTTNGTSSDRAARKSLADQIDRLDGILDGLAEALNESIADAVKGVLAQAVRDAVQAAVVEVLAAPELLRAALERHAPPAVPAPPPPRPEPPTLKENVARIGNGACAAVKRATGPAMRRAGEVCPAACAVVAKVPAALGAVARMAWASRKPCAIAAGVGLAFGAACYLGGPLLSVAANGLSGTALALSTLTLPLKRLFRRAGAVNS